MLEDSGLTATGEGFRVKMVACHGAFAGLSIAWGFVWGVFTVPNVALGWVLVGSEGVFIRGLDCCCQHMGVVRT